MSEPAARYLADLAELVVTTRADVAKTCASTRAMIVKTRAILD
jgi:hypothetical protein